MLFNHFKKGLIGVLLGGTTLFSSFDASADQINLNLKLYDTNNTRVSNKTNIVGHALTCTDGYDSGVDAIAPTNIPPSGASVSFYTIIPGKVLSKDWRSKDSVSPFNGNIKFLSALPLTNFSGRYEARFNFKNGANEYIDSNMFYWAKFVLPVQFSSNGVEQVEQKAIISNMDTNRDTYFNITGVQVPYTNAVDFSNFEVNRALNKFSFPTNNSNGNISVTNSNGNVTNGQVFVYNPSNNLSASFTADPGYGLKSFDLIRQDINTGNIYTNNISFSDNFPSSYSTNLEGIVGENSVQNISFTNLPQSTVTINPGVFNVSPTNTSVPYNGNLTANVANIYVYDPTNPAIRTKFTGFEKIE